MELSGGGQKDEGVKKQKTNDDGGKALGGDESREGAVKSESGNNQNAVKAQDALKAEAQLSSEESDDDLFGKPGGADVKTKVEGSGQDQQADPSAHNGPNSKYGGGQNDHRQNEMNSDQRPSSLEERSALTGKREGG